MLRKYGKPLLFSPSELAHALDRIVQNAVGYDLNSLKSHVETFQRENSLKWKDMEDKEKKRDEILLAKIKDLMKEGLKERKEEWDERAKQEWKEEEEFKKQIVHLQEKLDKLMVSLISL